MAGMQRVRFRPHQAILLAAVVAFIGALPIIFGPDLPSGGVLSDQSGSHTPVRWVFLPILLIPIGVFVWVLRSGTDADADGLRLRAVFGERRVSWTEVRELSGDPWGRAVALLTDGNAVALPAVRAADLPRLVAASGKTVEGTADQ
jgi:hypothetical protein